MESFNVGPSERRDVAVVHYVAAQGVDTTKLTAKGYGKTRPRVADPFDAANRRLETGLRAE